EATPPDGRRGRHPTPCATVDRPRPATTLAGRCPSGHNRPSAVYSLVDGGACSGLMPPHRQAGLRGVGERPGGAGRCAVGATRTASYRPQALYARLYRVRTAEAGSGPPAALRARWRGGYRNGGYPQSALPTSFSGAGGFRLTSPGRAGRWVPPL